MGLQFRRGTDSDRLGITPDVGEPLFTTDGKKLYIGDGATAGGILVSGSISDSNDVIGVIGETVDSAYIQARQADIFRDSAFVTDIIDTAYIQARDRIRDSGFVEDIVDSAFVQARQITYDFLDSAEAINLIDSAYVQVRQTPQDFAYSSLTGTPTTVSSFTNDANYLDSTTVTGVIDATYIQANQTTYDFLDSAEAIALIDSAHVQARQTPQDFAYSSLTGTPTNVSSFANDANYLDSSTVVGVITAAYIQANQTTYDTSDFTDSAYVASEISTAINNLIDGAPGTLDTLNEIAAALNDDDSAYATLVGLINDQLDSSEVIALIDAAYVQARQITYDTSDFTDSAFVTGLPVSTFTNDANYLDSTTVTGVIDATYIQSNQTTYDFLDSAEAIALIDSAHVQARQTPQDFAYSSLTGAPTNVSSFTNDANYLDSTTATVLIDSAYINARTDANIDSVALIALVDSAYIQARQAPGTDSAAVTSLITTTVDSAYVNARVSTVDSGQVLQIVELDGYTKLDSTDVINLLPDGTYRGLRTYTFTADSGDTAFTGTDDFGNTLTYSSQSLVVYVNGILLTDSVDYTALDGSTITLTNPADSADVITFHNIVAGGTDSALINQEILSLIDSAYVQARQVDLQRDSGFVTGIIDAAYIQANQTTYDFLDSSEAINLIDSAYVQARQSNADQSLNTTDSVTFASLIVTGDLQVNGTTTTVNTEDLSVTDHMIYLNAGESAGSPTASIDVGWAANVNDDGSYAHVGMFRDATDNAFKVYEGYTPEPDAGAEINTGHASFSLAPFEARTLTGQYLGFDSDFNTKTISDLVNDANYLDSTTVTNVIDATYIQANQTTYDFLDSAEAIALITGSDLNMGTNKILYSNVYDSIGALPSASSYHGMFAHVHATGAAYYAHAGSWIQLANNSDLSTYGNSDVISLVDSAYVQARQTAGTDSAATIALITATVDSAYVALREANAGGSGGTDSATVVTLVQSTVDSDYVLARIPDATLQGVNQFEFLADSGQTVFTGADRDGNSLTYNTTDVLVFLNGTLMVPGNDFNTTNSNTITFTEGVDSGDFVNIFNFTAGRAVGGGVSEVNHFDFTADSGQTAFTGSDDNGSILSFIGNDNIQVFINGILLKQSDYTISNNNTVTLTDGADSADEVRIIAYDTYSQRVAIDTYNFTADSGQTVFTGLADDGNSLVFSPGNLQVHLNGIMLRSGNDFSTSGTGTVTLVSGADSGDTLTVTAISGDSAGYATIVPAIVDSAYINARVTILDSADAVNIITAEGFTKYDSNDTIGLVDSAYIQARQTAQDFAYSSLTGAPTAVSSFTNDANYLDSTTVTGVIDASYIQANQTTYSTADFADSAYVTAQIDALIDGAPGTLNTLNEIAAALNDDDSAYATLVGLINAKTDFDSADATTLITSYGYSTYDSTNAAGQIEAYGYSTFDSNDVRTTRWSDNERLIMGDGSDLEIYHNGGNSFVRDLGTGNLVLDTNGISIVLTHSGNAEKMAEFFKNGGIDLYHNNVKKLSITDSSATVIGRVLASEVELDNGTIVGDGKIEIKNTTGSTPSYVDLYCEVSNAHYTRIQSEVHANYSGNVTLTTPTTSGTLALTSDIVDSAAIITLIQANDQQRDSAFVTGIIDSAYITARTSAGTDSASVIALITSTVDSAYVALREANAGGSGGSVDSAAIISLIQSTVDSAYVTARDPGGSGGVTFKTFQYLADSGQTIFTGTDDLGNSLAFVPDQYQVYRNGILLIDSADYNGTGGGTITLTDTSVTGDQITIATYTATVGSSINTYDYFADSGQTSFSGTDIDGNTLSFTGSNVLVHVNGLLLTDSNDYTRVGGSAITFGNGLDSGDIVSIIAVTDAVTSSGTDSATVVTLIEGTVDSAYIAARSAPGTDSATVQSIVQGLVDSAYVQARQSLTTGLLVDTYSYTADSAQTAFSGADNASNTLKYTAGEIQVFRNGILLVDSDDYTASNGTSITLTSGANLGDNLSVTAFSSADQIVQLNTFEYTADSGATSFSGTDDFGNSLTYNVGNILVHLNGILLTDSADYTANNGTTVVLSTAADSADILHISAFGTATALNKWRETAVSYTVDAGTKLIVDTLTGAVTVTLPASPIFGDEVKIIDGTGNAGTNNITINRNSNKILGADSDFTLDVNRAAVDLVYYNAAQGWIVSGNS